MRLPRCKIGGHLTKSSGVQCCFASDGAAISPSLSCNQQRPKNHLLLTIRSSPWAPLSQNSPLQTVMTSEPHVRTRNPTGKSMRWPRTKRLGATTAGHISRGILEFMSDVSSFQILLLPCAQCSRSYPWHKFRYFLRPMPGHNDVFDPTFSSRIEACDWQFSSDHGILYDSVILLACQLECGK